MKKRIFIAIAALVVVIAVLGGIKAMQIRRMIAAKGTFAPPPETVTAAVVQSDAWQTFLTAVGSLDAVQGVIVSAEMPGKIVKILFTPGAKVKAGDLLVQQDIASEQAQLRAAEATVDLARLNLDRKSKLLATKTISPSEFDNADAQLKQAVAQADAIRATIAKKTIRAPFSGHLGLRLVNLGQILREGQAIVSIQTLDPIFVTFSLPQQQLVQVKTGMAVQVAGDALHGKTIAGQIMAINPQVEETSRNIRMQATLSNPLEVLRPGMFVTVAVVLPAEEPVLIIPATAVLYAPYSDSVFVVEEKKNAATGQVEKVARQQFVRLNEKRGDFVSVLSGLQEGQTIVSTGVFKLRNGQTVVVDNTLAPEFKLAPKPENT
jgi:membrane fusion protein (multidrug efflux system)